MFLLYVDESGSVEDTKQLYFALAGVAVSEFESHWIERDLDKLAETLTNDDSHALEFHASPMRTGRGRWRSFPADQRHAAIRQALQIGVRDRFPHKARVFAAVLEKANFAGHDIVEVAFEQLSSRFDLFLKRMHRNGNTQRGIAIFDKCSTERRIQTLAREFKRTGHSYGITRNYAEVPLFVDSAAFRLIQLADLVAYAIFRKHQFSDSTYYDIISPCFDSEGGVIHGLYRK